MFTNIRCSQTHSFDLSKKCAEVHERAKTDHARLTAKKNKLEAGRKTQLKKVTTKIDEIARADVAFIQDLFDDKHSENEQSANWSSVDVVLDDDE